MKRLVVSIGSSKLGAALIAALVSIFLFLAVRHELASLAHHVNDVVFHASILHALHQAVLDGRSAFDFVYDGVPFGYPIFRAYQHLPHLFMYGCYRLLGADLSFQQLIVVFNVVLIVLLPFAAMWGARLWGFSWTAAGCSALLAPFIVEAEGFGFGLQNYLWQGGGLVTQLWAVVIAFPASGAIYRYLSGNGRLAPAAILFALATGCHLVAGFVFALSAVVISVNLGFAALRRLVVLGITTMVLTSYQWYRVVLDGAYVHTSPMEPSWKFDSRGAAWVISNLWNGDLFDLGRFPSVTMFLIVGVVSMLCGDSIGAQRDRLRLNRALFLLFVVSLLALSGPAFWGDALSGLPVLRALHFHRLIFAVHLYGVFLAALGLAAAAESALHLRSRSARVLSALLVAALVAPAIFSTWNRLTFGRALMVESERAEAANGDLSALVEELKVLPRGWVYAGFHHTWGPALRTGSALELRHRLLVEGFPVMGQLYHALGLSGDVIFDFDATREDHFDALGIAYVVAPPEWRAPPYLTVQRIFGRFTLYRYPRFSRIALAEVRGVHSEDLAPRELSGLVRAWFVSEDPARRSVDIIGPHYKEDRLVPFRNSSYEVAHGLVREERAKGSEYASAVVALDEPRLVVLKVGFHPQWHAEVDGKPEPTLWVTPGFVAVKCPEGEHHVTFFYRSKGVER